ncbi:MAG TPA: UbiA family prenyltransferase [Burkholderiaceae bacterium]|nr:UbiA family prenyltransferase [Burkholderiaceae bacterium]
MAELVPLFVDLDGTLLRSDLLYESIVRLIRQAPGQLLRTPWWLLCGKARLKHELAQRVRLDATTLPYNDAMCAYLVRQREQGRPLVLATGSNQRQAEAVARHLGLFSAVLASNADDNLTGSRKLQAIQQHNGGAFAYAGNARDDVPIWHHAERAVAVGAPEHIVQDLRQRGRLELAISVPRDRFALLRALRPHQWLKNLLVFLPALAVADTLNLARFWACCGAFVAFCLCASAIYLVNDLSDLEADRAHPRKRFRPFANGAASIAHGLIAVPVLLVVAFAIATAVSPTVVGVLGGYLLLTTAYTFVLKAYAILDVLSLAALYALRVLAGAAAIAVAPSFWMLAFSVFIFFSLALAKRAAELYTARTLDLPKARGRGYRVDDDGAVQMMGIAAGYLAVGVMALYLNSPEVAQRYHHPQWLWGLCPMLLLWVSRIWLKAVRGELVDDPLVFALSDLQSRMVVIAATLLIVSAMLL